MMYLLPLIAAAALSISDGVPEQPAVQGQGQEQAQADKKICRMIVPTGSIMGKRFCLTKQEWKDMNTQTEDSASSALSKRGTGMCDGKCPLSGT